MQLDTILQEAEKAIQSAADLALLQQCRVQLLGKKGQLTALLQSIGQLPEAERREAGQKINLAKAKLSQCLDAREAVLKEQQVSQQLAAETIDVTLPGRIIGQGSIHPITHTLSTLRHLFTQMGFVFWEGPEIEDDEHNFTRLNIPSHHPARAMHDTFYFADGLLLRTHTSTVQIRAMHALKPPLRVISMGRVYRRDFDVTHSPMFHQLECMVIDTTASLATLKGLLTHFLQAFFERAVAIRFRPSYFPFTEPSLEVDIDCVACLGKKTGCRVCKQTGYVEVLGCGMVHPNVLQMAKINTKQYRGFAIGAGIDRLAMLKYGLTDLRSLFENDVRFLRQF